MRDINMYIFVPAFIIIPIYIGLLIRFKTEKAKWTLKTFSLFVFMPFLVFIILPLICSVYIIKNTRGIKKITLSIKIIFLIIVFNQKTFDLLMTYIDKISESKKEYVQEQSFKDLPQKLTDKFCIAF